MLTASEYELLTVSYAARFCGVSQETIRAWERAGKITAIKSTSGRRLFFREELQRFNQERQEKKR